MTPSFKVAVVTSHEITPAAIPIHAAEMQPHLFALLLIIAAHHSQGQKWTSKVTNAELTEGDGHDGSSERDSDKVVQPSERDASVEEDETQDAHEEAVEADGERVDDCQVV